MRLLIAAVGKLKPGPERELYAHYLARAEALGRKLALSPLTSIELSEAKASSPSVRCAAEADALLARVPTSHKIICLDRIGCQLTSETFAQALARHRDSGAAGIVFLIGGADGLGAAALDKADGILSFGPMTLPHSLARIVLAEQLYRAETILSGHPYHRA
ncbi:MAG: 23S rRNA (pseudouridine(1915)-N(3))-methyltransferase RlmH [Methyloceanibacter sp.]